MLKTKLALAASTMLFSGCLFLPQERALPDPSIPHKISRETTVNIWVRRPDGLLVEETVRADPGWYLVSPQVADPPQQPTTLGTK